MYCRARERKNGSQQHIQPHPMIDNYPEVKGVKKNGV